jgi:hypothetical protein
MQSISMSRWPGQAGTFTKIRAGGSFEPTHADKQPAKRGDIGKVPTELCARWKEERA